MCLVFKADKGWRDGRPRMAMLIATFSSFMLLGSPTYVGRP